jgi:hypothetical protein
MPKSEHVSIAWLNVTHDTLDIIRADIEADLKRVRSHRPPAGQFMPIDEQHAESLLHNLTSLKKHTQEATLASIGEVMGAFQGDRPAKYAVEFLLGTREEGLYSAIRAVLAERLTILDKQSERELPHIARNGPFFRKLWRDVVWSFDAAGTSIDMGLGILTRRNGALVITLEPRTPPSPR